MPERPIAASSPLLPRAVLATCALLYAAASVGVVASAGADTAAGTSAAAAVLDVAAGAGLIAAGVGAALARPSSRLGAVTACLGATWFASDWAGAAEAPALVRAVGLLAAPFAVPALAHLVLLVPSDHVRGRAARLALVALWGVTAVAAVVRALVRDPYLDEACVAACGRNPLLVRAQPDAARAIATGLTRLAAVVALAALVVIVARLARTSAAGPRLLAPVLLPAALAAAALGVAALIRLGAATEDPRIGAAATAFAARAATLVLLAGGVGWAALRAWRSRRALARLAVDLGAAPTAAALQAALARSLGDDGLTVAYWLPASGCYVGEHGQRVDPSAGDGRATTQIVRAGEPVAVVIHDAALAGARELERAVGPTARLAIDNARLQAEVLAQLDALRASSGRIVETADAERRRLERDLHDGAQQRMLALSYDLRVARALAEAAGDAASCARLDAASAEAQVVLAELRELAHGIYPAVLGESGLEPALATLRDRAPIPVELVQVSPERHPAAVETAAYLVVSEAIDRAARDGARAVRVAAVRDPAALVVEVEIDGAGAESGSLPARDRVGALGGRFEASATSVRAALPCG